MNERRAEVWRHGIFICYCDTNGAPNGPLVFVSADKHLKDGNGYVIRKGLAVVDGLICSDGHLRVPDDKT